MPNLIPSKQYSTDSCGAAALVCIGSSAGWSWTYSIGGISKPSVSQNKLHENRIYNLTKSKGPGLYNERSLPSGIRRGAKAIGKDVLKAWKSQKPSSSAHVSWDIAIAAVDSTSNLKKEEAANAAGKTKTVGTDTLVKSDLEGGHYYLLCINDCSHWVAYENISTSGSYMSSGNNAGTKGSGFPGGVRIALQIG